MRSAEAQAQTKRRQLAAKQASAQPQLGSEKATLLIGGKATGLGDALRAPWRLWLQLAMAKAASRAAPLLRSPLRATATTSAAVDDIVIDSDDEAVTAQGGGMQNLDYGEGNNTASAC